MATWFAAKKDLKPDGDEKKGRYSFFARNQQKIAPYVFISPFFLIFTVFFLIPSITALVLSVFKWNGIGSPEFFQLKNYTRMFGDDVFWQAVFNTSIYAAVSLFDSLSYPWLWCWRCCSIQNTYDIKRCGGRCTIPQWLLPRWRLQLYSS